jgi:hypothetical protein
MEKRFKSEVGAEILLPLVFVFLFVLVASWSEGRVLQVLMVIGPIGTIVFYTLFSISYRIVEDQLIVRCGFLYRKSIAISDIVSVKPSRNILSSPAASLNRIEVRYGAKNFVLLSPSDKQGFVRALKQVNANIAEK